MLDYTDIPIHIRCTERYKIDPRYPGDHLFWKYHEWGAGSQEGWRSREGRGEPAVNEFHERGYQALLKNGTMSRSDFRRELGITDIAVGGLIMAMSFKYPIYQEDRGPNTFVGLLQEVG